MSTQIKDKAILLIENVRHWIDRHILHTMHNPLEELDDLYQKSLVEAEKRGVSEGKANKPAKSSPLHFEESISRSFNAVFTRITMTLMAYVNQLDAKLNAMRQEITKHPYYEKCVNLVQDFSRKKEEWNTEILHHENKVRAIESDFAIAKNIANRPTGQTNGWPFFLRYSGVFILALVLLGILDLPFSMASLENLNFGRAETLIVSCAIVISIAFLSHFGGLCLKRYMNNRSYRNWSFVILILIFGFLCFATISRYQYAVQNETAAAQTTPSFDFEHPDENDDSIIQRIQAFSFDSLADPTFWLFLFMNMLIFSAGIFLSFKVHDSNPDFEKTWCELQFNGPKYEKAISTLTGKVNELHALVEVQIQNYRILIDPILEAQIREYEEALSLRNVLSNYANSIASQVEDKVAEVIGIYRSSNLNFRTAPPLVEWSEPYQLEIARLDAQENNILKFFKK